MSRLHYRARSAARCRTDSPRHGEGARMSAFQPPKVRFARADDHPAALGIQFVDQGQHRT